MSHLFPAIPLDLLRRRSIFGHGVAESFSAHGLSNTRMTGEMEALHSA